MSRQGRHGESRFEALCQDPHAIVDAVVNRSNDDQHGWDHVIDLTPCKTDSLPADLQNHLVQCFAQIKTTRGRYPKTKVKLSNAIKSAKSPSPSFIFLFHYKEDGRIVLYGKHIWEADIAIFLRAARDASVNKKNTDLHKVALSINFTKENIIDSHPSDWMLHEIENNGSDRYAAKKIEIANSVGYDEFPNVGNFSIPSTTSMRDIVMHEIGYIEDLPVLNVSMFDNRFGIKSKLPMPSLEKGRISFSHKGKPLTLKVISASNDQFEMSAKLYVPTLVPYGHDEYKYRVQAGCIDIVVEPKTRTNNITFSFDLHKAGKFNHKIGIACFLSWSKNEKVDFEVYGDEGSLFRGRTGSLADPEDWLDQHATVGVYLKELLGDKRSKKIKISHQSFQENVADMYYAAVLSNAKSLRFEASFEGDVQDFEYILGYSCTSLDGWSIGAFYKIEIKARSKNGNKHTYYFSTPTRCREFVIKRPIGKFKQYLKEEFLSFRKKFDTPTAVIMDGNLENWGKNSNGDGDVSIDIE